MQASQWATRAKALISRISTAAPYSEYLARRLGVTTRMDDQAESYLSIFRATLTSLSSLAVLRRPMRVVV